MKLRTLIERDNVRADVRWTDRNPHMDCQDWPARHYVVTLKRQRRQMAVPFSCGLGIESEPTAADVLDCLLSDYYTADNTFDDWCAELGFNPDSRKAERTFKTVLRQSDRLATFLGDALETYLSAERL
jgi:hypothetical protein